MEWFVASPLTEFILSKNELIPIFEISEYVEGEILPGFDITKREYVFRDHIWAGGVSEHENNKYYRTNVCIYECTETKKQVVIKITPFTETEEINMIEHITRNKRYLIEYKVFVDVKIAYKAKPASSKAKTLKPENYNCIVMEWGGPTLHTLKKTLPNTKKADIMEKVAKMCETLLKQKLCYMDMKPSNIVYDELTDTVKFIDFGGVSHTNEKNTCSTYPLHTHMSGTNLIAQEKTVVYGLGALHAIFVELEDEYPFRYIDYGNENKLSSEEKKAIEEKASTTLIEHIKGLVDKKENIVLRILYKNTLLYQNKIEYITHLFNKLRGDYA